MARKYIIRSKEETLAIVKSNLAGETSWSLERETGCSHRLIQEWTRKYLAEGEITVSHSSNCPPEPNQEGNPFTVRIALSMGG